MDSFSAVPRFTFGTSKLLDGIEALPFMLGMFAAVEIFSQIRKPSDRSAYSSDKQADISRLVSIKEMLAMKWTVLRSGILEMCIRDRVTTTDELIPSGETASHRSNPYKISEYTLIRKDPAYVGNAKAVQAYEMARRSGDREKAAEYYAVLKLSLIHIWHPGLPLHRRGRAGVSQGYVGEIL